MEEKKTAKEISLDANAKNVKPTQPTQREERKATYEELNNYCMQLMNQNKQLVAQLQEREMFNMFKRLDYLFLVLKSKDCFSSDFVGDCVAEITSALTIPETADTRDEEEKKGE